MNDNDKPSLEEVVEHFGVRGMKWGTRHDTGHEGTQASPRKIAKLDKKFEKSAGSTKTFMKIYDAGADDFNKNKISVINNKPIYQKAAKAGYLLIPNHPVNKKYNEEAAKEFVDSLNKAARSLGTNASGTKQIGIHVLDGSAPGQWDMVLEDIKHDAMNIKVKVTRDAKGLITKLTMMNDSLTQGGLRMNPEDIPDLDDLEHVGVLGMKWGHRKTGTANQIRRARGNVSKQRSDIQSQQSNVNNASSDKSHRVENVKLNKLKADYLKNPDRIIAARMTTGEKAATLILTSLTFTLPLGLAGIAGTSARSRVIENNQDKRKVFN